MYKGGKVMNSTLPDGIKVVPGQKNNEDKLKQPMWQLF